MDCVEFMFINSLLFELDKCSSGGVACFTESRSSMTAQKRFKGGEGEISVSRYSSNAQKFRIKGGAISLTLSSRKNESCIADSSSLYSSYSSSEKVN